MIRVKQIIKEIEGDDEINFSLPELEEGIIEEFYMPYIKVKNLSEIIPDHLPNSKLTIYGDLGEKLGSRIKTWSEWIGKNYTISEQDGHYYFLSIANTGNSLPHETLRKMIDQNIELVNSIPYNGVG